MALNLGARQTGYWPKNFCTIWYWTVSFAQVRDFNFPILDFEIANEDSQRIDNTTFHPKFNMYDSGGRWIFGGRSNSGKHLAAPNSRSDPKTFLETNVCVSGGNVIRQSRCATRIFQAAETQIGRSYFLRDWPPKDCEQIQVARSRH